MSMVTVFFYRLVLVTIENKFEDSILRTVFTALHGFYTKLLAYNLYTLLAYNLHTQYKPVLIYYYDTDRAVMRTELLLLCIFDGQISHHIG